MVEYRKLAAFFDCPVLLTFFLDPTPRSNRWTDLHALWFLPFGVRTMDFGKNGREWAISRQNGKI